MLALGLFLGLERRKRVAERRTLVTLQLCRQMRSKATPGPGRLSCQVFLDLIQPTDPSKTSSFPEGISCWGAGSWWSRALIACLEFGEDNLFFFSARLFYPDRRLCALRLCFHFIFSVRLRSLLRYDCTIKRGNQRGNMLQGRQTRQFLQQEKEETVHARSELIGFYFSPQLE